ncbi:unnamed protein product [Spirodela intermedia]|nr:unnamed protein product [Spirodela intermedia]CAA6672269.1 unnamed protein product [Spirodela intermedia]
MDFSPIPTAATMRRASERAS